MVLKNLCSFSAVFLNLWVFDNFFYLLSRSLKFICPGFVLIFLQNFKNMFIFERLGLSFLSLMYFLTLCSKINTFSTI